MPVSFMASGGLGALPAVALMFIVFVIVGITFLLHPEDYSERLYKLHLSSIRLKQKSPSASSKLEARVAGVLFLVLAILMCYFVVRSL